MNKQSIRQFTTRFITACLILLLALPAIPVIPAQAAAITSAAGGAWSASSTWVGGVLPTASDDVTIANGHTVIFDLPFTTVHSLTIQGGNLAGGLAFSGSNALTITTSVSIAASTANNITKALTVGDGTLKVGTDLTITGGTSTTRRSQLKINTGTVTVSGALNVPNARSLVIFTDAGILNVAGTYQSTGGLTPGTGKVNYSGAAQAVANYTYYNLAFSGSGSKTISSGIAVNGNLSISGTAKADIGAGLTIHVNTLALNGAGQVAGTWGSSSSAAVHVDNNHFTSTTGMLNVAAALSTSAPTATTSAASLIHRTSATLNGLVNPNGDSTAVTFEYGTTTSYGSSVKAIQSPLTGTTATDVSAQVPGLLTPGTTYHFRVVGTNSAGTTYGTDRSFKTLAAGSTTYYVDKNNKACYDSGAGTSDVPFCTITAATGLADAGDTVNVLSGSYAETVKPGGSGGAGMLLTFKASSGVTVTGEPGNTTSGNGFRLSGKGYIVIDGFIITGTADYGIYAASSNHITIQNNQVSYSGSGTNYRSGIYLNTTTDSLISTNTTSFNNGDGIRLNKSSNNNRVEKNISFGNAMKNVSEAVGINLYANSSNNWILNNITYANEDSGINLYTGSGNNHVIDNLSYGNGDHGIDNNASPYNIIVGNTVQGNVTVGINLEQDQAGNGSNGATLMNNISVDNGYRRLVGGGTLTTANPGNIRVDSASTSGTTLNYDLIYSTTAGVVQIIWGGTNYTSMSAFQATGQEAKGLQADPLFLSPAPVAEQPASAPFNIAVNPGNYHLNDLSPAIDSANSSAPDEQTADIEGNARMDDPAVTDSGAGTFTYYDRGAYEFQLKSVQTITWSSNAPTDATYLGKTYIPTATASSSLPVTITVDAAASTVCAIDSSGVVSFTGVGDCVLDGNQKGNQLWAPAPQVQQIFPVGKANQTITFNAPTSPAAYLSTFAVNPTSSSGLPVTVTATGACSILNDTVTMTSGTGDCTLTAAQDGNALYYAALPVVQTVAAQKLDQHITVSVPAGPVAYLDTFEFSAASDSGLPVSVTPSGVCTVQGSTVTMTSGTGDCTLTFSQEGNENYNPATPIVKVVAAKKADQTISFTSTAPVNAVTFGATYTPLATSTSGLPVAITVDATASSVCSISAGGVVSFMQVGTCVLDANQAGNDFYNLALQVQQSFSVGQGFVKVYLPMIFR